MTIHPPSLPGASTQAGRASHADHVLDLLAARPWTQPIVTEVALPRRPAPVVPAVPAVAPGAGFSAPAARRRWPGRSLVAMVLGGSSALLGCASADPQPWQVQPLLRSGASSSAALRDGYTSLARRHEYEDRWVQAAQAWDKAVQAEPSNPALHTALGVALAHAGRPADAVVVLRRAVELSPGSAQSLNNLGYALWLAGQPDEAVQALKAALAIDPAHRAALANLALADPAPAGTAAGEPQPVPAETVAAAPAAEAEVPPLLQVQAHPSTPPVAVQTRPNLDALSVAEAGHQAGEAAVPDAAAEGPQAAVALPAAAPAHVAIANGMGVAGAAAKLGALLAAQGLPRAALHNLPPYQQATTVVQYRAGFAAVALQVAAHIPDGAAVSETALEGRPEDVRVILGRDRRTALALCVAMNQCAGSGPGTPTEAAKGLVAMAQPVRR